MLNKFKAIATLAAFACFLVALPAQAALVDVIFVVDESGSMGTEHAWLGPMVSALSSGLASAGFTANYGLYGYTSGGPREILDGGDAAAFAAATGSLVTTGGTEDGYQALNFAFNNFMFTTGAVRNYVLVTDEDRDVVSGDTFASINAALLAQSALLNVVVNNPFGCTGGGTGSVIGRTTSDGYRADGSGGFALCNTPTTGNGAGSTETDYVPLALGLGGGAWNLNILRAGGNDATSFTKAFVDIKVQEIIRQEVPEPSSFFLGGTALIGLGLLRRRRNKA